MVLNDTAVSVYGRHEQIYSNCGENVSFGTNLKAKTFRYRESTYIKHGVFFWLTFPWHIIDQHYHLTLHFQCIAIFADIKKVGLSEREVQ